MAKDKKSKQAQLKSLASKGHGANRSKHLNYGDLSEKDVHTGNTSYRGTTVMDSPGTNRFLFAHSVRANNSQAKGFRLGGKIYKYMTSTGSKHSEVKVQ